MTDRARELLERALNFFEEICDSRSVGIEKSINVYLAETEVRPFVRLTEEEVSQILSSAHTLHEAICAVENRLVEKNK